MRTTGLGTHVLNANARIGTRIHSTTRGGTRVQGKITKREGFPNKMIRVEEKVSTYKCRRVRSIRLCHQTKCKRPFERGKIAGERRKSKGWKTQTLGNDNRSHYGGCGDRGCTGLRSPRCRASVSGVQPRQNSWAGGGQVQLSKTCLQECVHTMVGGPRGMAKQK